MKHIYLNLKRFDVPVAYGGVNRLAPMQDWGAAVVRGTQEALGKYDPAGVEFVQYLPEAHLISAVLARTENSPVQIGCQGVYRMNTAVGGNFGAFTTNRPASAARAIGCTSTLIGHCEERNDKKGILAEAGVADTGAVNRLLNQEIKCAQASGLTVLYCIGETSEEQPQWEAVLGEQLDIGLEGVDRSRVVHRPGQDPGRQGLHHQNRPFCQGAHRGDGCGLRRRPEGGQRRHAGLHRRDRRRPYRPHPFPGGDRVLPGGVFGNYSLVFGGVIYEAGF